MKRCLEVCPVTAGSRYTVFVRKQEKHAIYAKANMMTVI